MLIVLNFILGVISGVISTLLIEHYKKIKTFFWLKYRTILFSNKEELLHKRRAFRLINKLALNNNINELVVKSLPNKKLISKLDDAKKRSMLDIYERKEMQIKNIITLIYGEKFRNIQPLFSMTKHDLMKIMNISIRLLPNIQDEGNNINDNEIFICCILDNNNFNFNVPIKRECINDVLKDIPSFIEKNTIEKLKSYNVVVEDIAKKDKDWIQYTFIPHLVVSIVKTKTQGEIDELDLEYYYNFYNWKVDLA